MRKASLQPPSGAFIGASWVSLLLGAGGFIVGLWNAEKMVMSEKGFYLAVLLLGLFAAVSLQKAVRDRLDGIPVTNIYFGLAWLATGASLLMLAVGLWHASLNLSEKGFYGMSFALALFASVAVQKNIRDRAMFAAVYGEPTLEPAAPSDEA